MGIPEHPVQELKVPIQVCRNVTLYNYALVVNLILRILMYIVCGVVMKGYVPTYIDIPEKEQLSIFEDTQT